VRTPYAILAADHGRPLEDMLATLGLPSGPDAQRAFKADLVDAVGPEASGVLLDPDVSLPGLAGRLVDGVDLLVRIEADDVETVRGVCHSQLIPGLGADGARALGGAAAKVMVFLRPDRDDGHATALVRAAVADCRQAGIVAVIELMTYRLDDESPARFAARREDLIVAGAVLLQGCGAEVLKLEYPGGERGCRRVTDALDVPWAVLSAGVDHDEFRAQLRAAMAGGAAGFIAGRSVWKEAVGLPAAERRAFLYDVARRRFAELVSVVAAA
jgi:sulfofructosephosphate aldolase